MSEEHNTNADHEALKGFVERLFNVETAFADVKSEYTESKKDLKTEIKGREDETGVTWAQVAALAKTRMDEVKAREEQAATNSNMALYEDLYGFAPNDDTAAMADATEEPDPFA